MDFDTAETGNVTVRDRDTMQQEIVPIKDLVSWLEAKIDF
ncbi:MAG: His/Gly/Thr/Pro-type tRNA ligase C-terminal domain-containing protein [bacterium]